ncbi:4Fe-4S dicluster domain-containing protein [Termitidicoccus mucosus]|uniref:4Fe-4S ferredoxin n=1 Tax=Termitidicoccus mucosus TaxID=1184151 RepID=A0A178IGT7_9BACT|nr:4Fe-4S ferredoxin [Opitutaceae bacterium TSB47]
MRSRNLPKLLRVVIALACFAVALVAFLDYRDLVPAAPKHAIAAAQFVPSALALGTGAALSLACLVILAATLALGRVYCSTLCPLGVFQDIVSRAAALARKIFGKRKTFLPFRPAHEKTRHVILVLALLAVAAGWGGFALAWLDPYSNFGRFAGTLFRPPVILANNLVAALAQKAGFNAVPPVGVPWAGIGVFLPVLAIFGVVTVMSAWRGRLYCNTVCPVGTLLGLVSRRALWRLAIDQTACVRCGDCLKNCKAQCIDLRTQTIDHSRCVGCFDCIAVCDENGIGHRWLGRAPKGPPKNPRVPQRKNFSQPAQSGDSTSRRSFIAANLAGALALGTAAPLFAAAHAGGDGERHRERHRAGGRAIAPPGSRGAREFTARCTACQLCVSACPSHVIEPALLAYGTLNGMLKPRLNFDHSFCNFDCTVCGEVCPDGAIQPLTRDTKHTTRIGVAEVTLSHCIVITEDTACGACAEHCPTAALQMKPGDARFAQPEVSAEYCIGCGACQYACPAHPVKAVIVRGLAKHETASVLVQEKAEAPKGTEGDFAF